EQLGVGGQRVLDEGSPQPWFRHRRASVSVFGDRPVAPVTQYQFRFCPDGRRTQLRWARSDRRSVRQLLAWRRVKLVAGRALGAAAFCFQLLCRVRSGRFQSPQESDAELWTAL